MRTIVKPIEMVNWMDKEGVTHPVRFRITGEDESVTVVKIARIHQCDREMISGGLTYTFRCEVILNGQIRLCEIRFYPEKSRWVLFKM